VGDLPALGFFGYDANLHEGHGTVGEWQGNGIGTAWARHDMCELAFTES
jgi:hypothetical protein